MSQNVQQDLINKNVNSNLKNNDLGNSSNDIKQQDAINDALVKSGLPQNKLNGLISMVQDHLLCDGACQKQRTAENLKKLWDNSENNLKTAPEQVEIAEKNYYVYDKGYPKYQDLLFDRYSKTAAEMKAASIQKNNDFVNQINVSIKSYEDATIYLKRMYELLEIKSDENTRLKDDIDAYIGTVQTNDRKVDYASGETSWIGTVRTVLTFIYYSLLVIYFLISDYFTSEKYKSKKVWFLLVAYIAFPYFLNWIIVQLYYLIKYTTHKFQLRPYKNVYTKI